MRVIHSIGPGDLVGIHHDWALGQPASYGMNVPYARQLLDVIHAHRGHGYFISSNANRLVHREDRIVLEHRPDPSLKRGGLRFHLGQTVRALRLVFSALRYRADVAVVAEGGHWWALAPMRLLGIRIIPSLHCVLWQKYKTPSWPQRVMLRLNGWFFRRCCFAVMTASSDISEQVAQLCGGRDAAPPIVEFLPLYLRQSFAAIAPADHGRRPFHVFFAGRIERNKGVFELLNLAERFRSEGRGVVFDIAGRGGALEELTARAKQLGLAEVFRCHGYCGPQRMVELLSESHVVIVPTTADFVEGFNQVVAEGVLAGRPVITSAVCPALEYVRDAVVEVPVDDWDAYRRTILKLFEDADLYERKRRACLAASEQFFDPRNSWGAGAAEIFTALVEGRKPRDVMVPTHRNGGGRRVERRWAETVSYPPSAVPHLPSDG